MSVDEEEKRMKSREQVKRTEKMCIRENEKNTERKTKIKKRMCMLIFISSEKRNGEEGINGK